jgi:uncharacterized protein (TIGR01777 family)
MALLITGASGLVGNRFIEMLLSEPKWFEFFSPNFRSQDIRLLGRNIDKLKEKFSFPCSLFEWNDPLNNPPPEEALKGVRYVLHLAGENVAGGRWTQKRRQAILKSRQKMTDNLILGFQKLSEEDQSLEVFVSANAIGIYGTSLEKTFIEENVCLLKSDSAKKGELPVVASYSDFLQEVCTLWEQSLNKLPSIVRVVSVRTGIVLSDQGGALEKMLPAFEMYAGGRLGHGKQWMSWIHIDDLVRIYKEALTQTQYRGAINATSPNPVTNHDFSKELCKVLKRPLSLPVPSIALKCLFGEMSDILLKGQKVLPQKLVQSQFSFRFQTLNQALEDLISQRFQGVHRLRTYQYIPKPLTETFNFFSQASNLEKITPPFLNFTIEKMSTPVIQKDTMITYKLSLHGIPIKWVSLISQWSPNNHFVDEQLKGPYSKWHHSHSFQTWGTGTLVYDTILYKAPLGILGSVFAMPFIQKDLKKIFRYRLQSLSQFLGSAVQ